MSTSTTAQDEWIFSVRLPITAEHNGDTTTAGTTTSASGRFVELRQAQPPRTESHKKDSASQDGTSASPASPSPEQERVSLLGSSNISHQHKATSPAACANWTLTSPYWSLESDELLTVAYSAAWQTMPEFTTQTPCGRGVSCLLSCCRRCCAADQAAQESFQETFTVDDIVRVQTIPNIMVAGVGPCRAVKLYLRPLHLTDELKVPDHWQAAWERHVHRMSNPLNQASSSTAATTENMSTDDEVHTDDMSDNQATGPVLTFCLPKLSQVDPPLLWKVHLPCTADQPPLAIESMSVFAGRILTAAHDSKARAGSSSTSTAVNDPTHIYIQGYQSWSFTGSIVRGEEQPQPALPDAFSRAFNAGAAPPPSVSTVIAESTANASAIPRFQAHQTYCYQSDFFTCITSDGKVPARSLLRRNNNAFPYQQLDETGGPAAVLGWLSQHQQFGLISVDKDLRKVQMNSSHQRQVLLPIKSIETDWAYAQLVTPHSFDEEPMAHFLHTVAGYNHARPLQNGSLLTGWCSWYHYYENISEDSLRENFAKLAAMRTKVPTNVAVVDDGYMTAWGDWDSLKPKNFSPLGLGNVAQDIVDQNMRPGVWLAPFAADKFSQVVQDHPDWVIRNDAGIPANSSNCGKFFYGLDATNPEVRAYVTESIRRAVHEWKFDVLKIDFLYAACLEGNGKYDLSMSRAQAMHVALQTIRDAAGPDIFLIGCGCPIASGVGYVDGMRISADTGPTWYPALPLPWWDHGTLPCLRSMVRNSMSRAPMGHRWWHNDPDCLLLGESTRLTDQEVASAASIVAMTCGMMLLSDDLTKIPVSRMRTLTKIFPMTGVTAVVLDLHSTNDGLPSLLRLWCTDKYNLIDDLRDNMPLGDDAERDHNAEATFFARQASFHPDAEIPPLNERTRSCIHVTKGLGTWTVVSLSNWSDKPALVSVPPPALLPPPQTGWGADDDSLDEDIAGINGYHVFAFWSSKYTWIPNHRRAEEQGLDETVSKKMAAHETEIFHSKLVTPHVPQYIGSDLHFSCGQEVRSFQVSKNTVQIQLKTDYNRVGYIFVFVPTSNTERIRATMNGEKGKWSAVGNTPNMNENGSPRLMGRIIRIMVIVHANGTPQDGQINIEF